MCSECGISVHCSSCTKFLPARLTLRGMMAARTSCQPHCKSSYLNNTWLDDEYICTEIRTLLWIVVYPAFSFHFIESIDEMNPPVLLFHGCLYLTTATVIRFLHQLFQTLVGKLQGAMPCQDLLQLRLKAKSQQVHVGRVHVVAKSDSSSLSVVPWHMGWGQI